MVDGVSINYSVKSHFHHNQPPYLGASHPVEVSFIEVPYGQTYDYVIYDLEASITWDCEGVIGPEGIEIEWSISDLTLEDIEYHIPTEEVDERGHRGDIQGLTIPGRIQVDIGDESISSFTMMKTEIYGGALERFDYIEIVVDMNDSIKHSDWTWFLVKIEVIG